MALTKKQLLEVRASLTIGDAVAAEDESFANENRTNMFAFYRRAQKLGFINGQSFEDFLDDLPATLISEAFAETQAPLGNAPDSSPPSATSGE